jgi:CRISPR/Cas system CSM-associated protein Csm3 (group 7 of RAMP superfamily)
MSCPVPGRRALPDPVHDAVAEPGTTPGYRDEGTIDRVTGAAADGLLYSPEVVPPGTRFPFRLTGHEP